MSGVDARAHGRARLASVPQASLPAHERPEGALVVAARAGDEGAFRALTEPCKRELHVHCYRMLGSLHDAEDLVQETLLRAWNRLDSYEGRAPFRAWLYKIATYACLNELGRRRRQLPPRAYARPADPADELVPYSAEITQLEPYPDVLYDELRAEAGDPHARYLAHETIELAFLTAIQLLPPRQRAVLILREVLGFSASEAAALLEITVPAVNSALQRARGKLAKQPTSAPETIRLEADSDDAEVLRRYMRAFEAADVRALAALLKEDVILTMPPAPSWYSGRDSVTAWFSTSPYAFGDATRRFRLLPTRANRQPAFAAYTWDPEAATFKAYGLMVLQLADGLVAEITGFGDASLFPFFSLPDELAA